VGQKPIWTLWKRDKSPVLAGIRTPDRPARTLVATPTAVSRAPREGTYLAETQIH